MHAMHTYSAFYMHFTAIIIFLLLFSEITLLVRISTLPQGRSPDFGRKYLEECWR